MLDDRTLIQAIGKAKMEELLEQLIDYGHLSVPERQRSDYLSIVRELMILLKEK